MTDSHTNGDSDDHVISAEDSINQMQAYSQPEDKYRVSYQTRPPQDHQEFKCFKPLPIPKKLRSSSEQPPDNAKVEKDYQIV